MDTIQVDEIKGHPQQFTGERTKNPTENKFDRIHMLSAWCSPRSFFMPRSETDYEEVNARDL